MDNSNDIRWKQRFSNFQKALKKLSEGIALDDKEFKDTTLGDIVNEGLVKCFEFTHELAWNVMKDYAAYQGFTEIRGSRDAIRYALSHNLIADSRWMDMINARNQTAHDYNQDTANDIVADIKAVYITLFKDFETTMKQLCMD